MKVVLKSGTFDTSALYNKSQENVVEIEKCAREAIEEVEKYSIGYIIPLGTLGNAPSQQTQFKSNFHIIAYTIADNLIDRAIDFEDFNITEKIQEQGLIYKMVKRLDDFAEEHLGKGWRITLFNVKISTAIESMCKGNNDIDSMKKAIEDFYNIVVNRVRSLSESSEGNKWKHDMVEVFYTPLRALSINFVKMLDRRSETEETPLGNCNSIIIETLVYDTYANGLRLLTNTESFASSKIRIRKDSDETMLFVLKARVNGESTDFRPIRQFDGKSRVGVKEGLSGCSERIIYNIVNKNYKHWSFISLPANLTIKLNNLK